MFACVVPNTFVLHLSNPVIASVQKEGFPQTIHFILAHQILIPPLTYPEAVEQSYQL